MRVLVMGASGYVGRSVAKAFRAKGHIVYGLVRSQDDAALLSLDEIWPVVGNLEQPESVTKILQEVEVAVHCAYSDENKAAELDEKAINLVLEQFSKSSFQRIFIYTSGVWLYGSLGYKVADESMNLNPLEIVKWRLKNEEKVLKASSSTLNTVVIRPGHVYGGFGGLTGMLFATTLNGAASIPGEGKNRWPMVHHQDLAHAYVSAAEKELNKVVLNVVDDSSLTLREIGEAIARASKLELKTLSPEDSKNVFGNILDGFMIDLTVDNSRIKRLLGWQIHHAPFIYEADLHYNSWKAKQAVEF